MEQVAGKPELRQSVSSSAGEWTSAATQAIAPHVYEQAIFRMSEVFSRVEAKRGVIVPEQVRRFVSDMVLESLHLRGDEWRQRCNADPAIETHAAHIGEQIHESLFEILSNAEVDASVLDSPPRLTLVGVLRSIYDRWCRIYPFCKTSCAGARHGGQRRD